MQRLTGNDEYLVYWPFLKILTKFTYLYWHSWYDIGETRYDNRDQEATISSGWKPLIGLQSVINTRYFFSEMSPAYFHNMRKLMPFDFGKKGRFLVRKNGRLATKA